MVNRLWGLFFGRPLVPTPSNFGHSGMAPTHPELLDDLAVRFMENGWSIKSLAREIVLSATYRQASRPSGADDQFFNHGTRHRLSVEQWRDAVLAVSGELAETPGAKSKPVDEPDNHQR